MIKFNVKSLILAFCVLGGMVTAGVASAIPERYVITGGVTGSVVNWFDFYNNPFTLEMDVDFDNLHERSLIVALMSVDQLGEREFNYKPARDQSQVSRFDASRSIYSENGLIINRLIAEVVDPDDNGFFNLDIKLLQDGSIFDSSFSFGAGNGFVFGSGTVDSASRTTLPLPDDNCMIVCNPSVALPTPSSAFLMLPLLLFAFRRSLLNMFNTFKPVRALAA